MLAERVREPVAVTLTPNLTERVLVRMPDGRLLSARRLGPLGFRDGELLLYEVIESTASASPEQSG